MAASLLEASNKDLKEDAQEFIQDEEEPRDPFPLDETQEPRQQRKITSRYPSSMRCWNGLQSILSSVSLMGIQVIIKS